MWGQLVAAYMSIPGHLRPFLNWGFRAVVTGTFLSFWMNVATFAYAVRYGARPPVEGVPFLSLIAGVAGAAVVFLAFVTISAVPGLLRLLRELSRTIEQKLAELLQIFVRRQIPSGWALGLSRSIMILATLLAVTSAYENLDDRGVEILQEFSAFWVNAARVISRLAGLDPDLIGSPYLFVVGLLTFVATIILLAVTIRYIAKMSDRAIHVFGSILFLAGLFSLATATLLTPFDYILRTAQFGGGVKLNVLTRDNVAINDAYLFVMSENSMTLWDEKRGRFYELNRDYLIEINYLPNDSWLLPEQRGVEEILRINDQRDLAGID